MKNLIQIAGVIDQNEADMLIACGVDWLGFPLRLPVHKEDLSEETAKYINNNIFPKGVLITYLDQAAEIISLCRYLGIDKVQLHGPIDLVQVKHIKALTNIIIIKSLVIRQNNTDDLESQIKLYAQDVDAFITDTYDPVTGASGATGKTHDWKISARLNRISPKPLILAGGLTPDNVAEAIEYVNPAGVDAHTGVEGNNGRKKREKIEKFIREAKKTWKI